MATRSIRVDMAKNGDFGTAVMTFEQAAARLAGGFSRGIDNDTLSGAIHEILPATDLGELNAIKVLPGMTSATAETLHKVWRSGLNLQARTEEHPRIAAMAALEQAVIAKLPSGMLRPCDLVERAISRIVHAPAVLGSIEIVGQTEMSPCWRPLLLALTRHIAITWQAGPRHAPEWLDATGVKIIRTAPTSPALTSVSAATALHEVVEAIRWARKLVASGRAKPSEIAIAAASPSDYDDHMLTLRSDANLDIRFVHGTSAIATRDGQAAAALADILSRGLGQARLRRLASLCRETGLFAGLPEGWLRILPEDAPLSSPTAWARFLAQLKADAWPDGADHAPQLGAIIRTLGGGLHRAEEIGREILPKSALRVWLKAMENGPAVAIPITLNGIRIDDSAQAPAAIAWMPASALSASPRPFVRLLGLTSRAWPRLASEDRLLPDHIIHSTQIDPLPIGIADRRDFETILATTRSEIVLSRPRRDGEGRMLGKSPLLHGVPGEDIYLRRNSTPAHAMSEVDRLAARIDEFITTPLAVSAKACWIDWHTSEITPHDGLVRADHPTLDFVLARNQSATSLRKLLRDPLGFVWRYGLGLKSPRMGTEPLTLDNRGFGEILHATLDGAVKRLEAEGGLASATSEQVHVAISAAAQEVASQFEATQAVPPPAIWMRTLEDMRNLATVAIRPQDEDPLPGQKSYAEVPFARVDHNASSLMPWDPTRPVRIPSVGFLISGFIDRLDLAGDHSVARVSDYKTGKPPKGGEQFIINGGKELQRCLYAFAVKVLLGDEVEVEAVLRYPRSGRTIALENADTALSEVAGYLATARDNLKSGRALPGPDTADQYNDLLFALPANSKNGYQPRKQVASTTLLGPAAAVWEAL
ncbi:PD-(D/E)XK nuclease family protein [Methylobacterium sp. SD274]|uniref:PD-(D/E)XK nuclease family protein n=1 Tax=Methylobacterium sp. SD274 TaxID=2782009 RepID=UPI001A969E40|nr:PD-(D/E)XK nuclease family protein [Methylobacterium sp. SD274]MBO1022876.1 PD-(D/E)XK nuclease family protein [Methylobacterium sp. SD274]